MHVTKNAFVNQTTPFGFTLNDRSGKSGNSGNRGSEHFDVTATSKLKILEIYSLE